MRKRKIRSNNFYTMIGNSLILFIIGLLLVMLVLGQDLLDSLREEFTFQLELEEDLSSDDVDQISSMLRQLAYVDQNSIQYQNKIEIANDFKEDLGISSDDNMLEEALFDAISLKLKSTEINSADIIRAKSDFMKIPLVQRVNHIEDLSKGLFDNMETLRFVGFVLSLVLCLVLTILI
ncbi:MAG: permease-like cell division protein FtsX, partial [Bacteroidia bacterium]|nr:permease-like cell division protein FtsX [Bacteroidia bacterium]